MPRPECAGGASRVCPLPERARAGMSGMAEVGGIAGERLRPLVEGIERLLEDRAAVNADIREVYAEGKAAGFDVKIVRRLIRLRQMEEADGDNHTPDRSGLLTPACAR